MCEMCVSVGFHSPHTEMNERMNERKEEVSAREKLSDWK